MRQYVIAHQKQKRGERNRTTKVEALNDVHTSLLFQNNQEAEQRNPRHEEHNTDDLALLYRECVVRSMASNDKTADDGAEERAGTRNDSCDFVEGVFADNWYNSWAVQILRRANMTGSRFDNGAGIEVVLPRYYMHLESRHCYQHLRRTAVY